mmetsp:Transcript_9025/g.19894  ORF Transcript_9025/g.19894 Transcript_9025/m.19894 type:complete len:210 (-) Transcript_9025:163-792(-)
MRRLGWISAEGRVARISCARMAAKCVESWCWARCRSASLACSCSAWACWAGRVRVVCVGLGVGLCSRADSLAMLSRVQAEERDLSPSACSTSATAARPNCPLRRACIHCSLGREVRKLSRWDCACTPKVRISHGLPCSSSHAKQAPARGCVSEPQSPPRVRRSSWSRMRSTDPVFVPAPFVPSGSKPVEAKAEAEEVESPSAARMRPSQ